MTEIAMGGKDESLKPELALRCAKAAMLLSSLKCSSNHRPNSSNSNEHEYQEMEMLLKREVEDLKLKLVRERMNSKKVKLCSLIEFLVQVMILMSLWTVCLILASQYL